MESWSTGEEKEGAHWLKNGDRNQVLSIVVGVIRVAEIAPPCDLVERQWGKARGKSIEEVKGDSAGDICEVLCVGWAGGFESRWFKDGISLPLVAQLFGRCLYHLASLELSAWWGLFGFREAVMWCYLKLCLAWVCPQSYDHEVSTSLNWHVPLVSP